MKVKAPKEDPRAKLARDREQGRADAAYLETAAEGLDDETRRRLRRLGRRTPGGSGMGVPGGSVGGGPAGFLSRWTGGGLGGLAIGAATGRLGGGDASV